MWRAPRTGRQPSTTTRRHPQIEDIVVSGGDISRLKAANLRELGTALLDIPTVRRIRLATKAVSVQLMKCLERRGLDGRSYRVSSPEGAICSRMFASIPVSTIRGKLRRWSKKRCAACIPMVSPPLRNQSVLLAGVGRDDPDTLRSLYEALGAVNIHPYYLYLCDMVKGTEHFRVSLATAQRLEKEVRGAAAEFNTTACYCRYAGGQARRAQRGVSRSRIWRLQFRRADRSSRQGIQILRPPSHIGGKRQARVAYRSRSPKSWLMSISRGTVVALRHPCHRTRRTFDCWRNKVGMFDAPETPLLQRVDEFVGPEPAELHDGQLPNTICRAGFRRRPGVERRGVADGLPASNIRGAVERLRGSPCGHLRRTCPVLFGGRSGVEPPRAPIAVRRGWPRRSGRSLSQSLPKDPSSRYSPALRAGAAYMPIDPGHPDDRVRYIIEEAEISIVISEDALVDRIRPVFDGAIVSLDPDAAEIAAQSSERLTRGQIWRHSRRSLLRHLYVGDDRTPERRHDRASQRLSLCPAFNTVCATTPSGPDLSGLFARLRRLGRGNLDGLLQWGRSRCRRPSTRRASAMTSRNIWRALASPFLPPPDHVVDDDRRYPDIAAACRQRRGLPTGARCAVVAAWPFDPECLRADRGDGQHDRKSLCIPAKQITVGHPLAGYSTLVLNSDMRPLPRGTKGELSIGRFGVCRGYLKQAELTSAISCARPSTASGFTGLAI